MATGHLGASDLSTTTNTTVYTVPASTIAACTVNICNRNNAAVTIRLALASSATPSPSEWIEYETPIPAYGILERTGILLNAGKMVVAYSSSANVSVGVYGYEE